MEQILKDLDSAETLESYEKASDAAFEYLKSASKEDRTKMGKFYLEHTKRLLEESEQTRKEAEDLIAEYYSLTPDKK